MKTLFSTLLLAFAVVMVSCGPKAPKAEETVVAPEEIVVVDQTAAAACTCGCEEGKECTCEKCPKAKEEVAVDEVAKKAE